MKNKVLLMVMTLLMCLVCVSAVVFADGSVAKVGDTPYDTLSAALEAANASEGGGKVVVLGNSADTVTVFDVTGDVVLDLNGKTVNAVLTVKGGTLTLQDTGSGGTLEGSVVVDVSSDDAGKTGTFNMGGGTITAYDWDGYNLDYAVKITNGEFNMTGGKITKSEVGGVYVGPDTTFKVSGSAEISGNTKNAEKHNVYLTAGQVIVIGDGGFSGKVYVTPDKWPTKAENDLPIATYDPSLWVEYDGTQCFFPDIDHDYTIKDERSAGMTEGQVVLVNNQPDAAPSPAPGDAGGSTSDANPDEGEDGGTTPGVTPTDPDAGDDDETPGFTSGGECEETDCGGHYVNGICNVDSSHYMAATYNEATGDYEISNAGQLYWFAAKVNSGENEINGKLKNKIWLNTGKFNADGDYTEDGTSATPVKWTPIGGDKVYKGTFDGDGYAISGLYINDSGITYAGLFGRVGMDSYQANSTGGTVKNVKIVNSYIKAANSGSSKKANVGGVVGYNNFGTIDKCSYSGTINIIPNSSTYVGGIAGYNDGGEITGCAHSGNVNWNANNYKYPYVGGIVGRNDGEDAPASIRDCHNDGDISIAVSTNAYIYAGGVAGYNLSSYGDKVEIIRCYNTGNISASSSGGGVYVGGIAGESFGRSNSETLAFVTDCYNSGGVKGITGNNCVYAGGMVGYADDTATTNGYNVGLVEGSNNYEKGPYLGSVVGYNKEHLVKNCYYLANAGVTVPDGIGYDPNGLYWDEDTNNYEYNSVTGVTDEVFKSGEIAWKLNGETATETEADPLVWKQTLGENDYPGFSGRTVYYGYTTCVATTKTYSNSVVGDTKPTHSINDSGYCTNCSTQFAARITDDVYNITKGTWYTTFAAALADFKYNDSGFIFLYKDIDEGDITISDNSGGLGASNIAIALYDHTLKGNIKVEVGTAGLYGPGTIDGNVTMQYTDSESKRPFYLGDLWDPITVTGKLTVNGVAKICQGVTVKGGIETTAANGVLLDVLQAKSAYADLDGNIIDGNVKKIDRAVQVIEHKKHDCIEATGKCSCGVTMGAKVTVGSGENETVTYYATVMEALAVVKDAEDNPTVTMLTDGSLGSAYAFPAGTYSIDLNGKELESDQSGATLAADTLINFKDSSTGNSGKVTAKLTLNTGAQIYLSGGTYSEIVKGVGKDILPDGYALKNSSGVQMTRTSWLPTGTLTNVTAVKCADHAYTVDPANAGCDYCKAEATVSVTANDEAKTTTYYGSFDAAYSAAAMGSTITLLADGGWSDANEEKTFGKNLTIDLNGHNFDSKTGYGSTVQNAAVTIKGESGTLDGFAMTSGKVTIEGGVTISGESGIVVYAMLGDSTLNINGGNINNVAVIGMNDKKNNSLAGDVTVNMSGGTVGTVGICTGDINVTGGKVTSMFDVAPADGDNSFTDAVITLSGGEFGEINDWRTTPGKLLADGYAFQSTTNTGEMYDYSSTRIYKVKVVKCEQHKYNATGDSKGKCKYCDTECTHESWTDEGKCSGCGVMAVAELSGADGGYYTTLSAAVAAIDDSMTSVYLLDDVTEDITINRSIASIGLQGHKINGTVTVASGGRVTIYDNSEDRTGYIKELNVETTGNKVTGGSYGKITVNSANCVNDLLVSMDGLYAYQKADGTCYNYNALTSTTMLENVKVIVCEHTTPNEDGKCPYCNYLINTERAGSDGTKAYYSRPTMALDDAEDGDVITMLDDYSYSAFMIMFEHSGCKVTFDLNGHYCGGGSQTGTGLIMRAGELTIKDSSENGTATFELGQYCVEDGTTLNIEGGNIKANAGFTVDDGGTLNISGGVYTVLSSVETGKMAASNALTYESGAKGSISGGQFNAIKAEDGLGKLLADGCYFKTSDGTKYFSDTTVTELENVTVQPVPITKLELLAGKDDYIVGETVTVTAAVTQPAGKSETVSYKWYLKFLDDEMELSDAYCDGNKVVMSILPYAADYTFRCEATIDGYTVKQSMDVNIGKATIKAEDYTAPTAASGLVFKDGYQRLVTDGSFGYQSMGINSEFYYRLDDDTSEWSNSVPWGYYPGEYTVYWYIKGGTNYYDLGSEDEPAGSITVTIAKKPTKCTGVDVFDKVYDGTEIADVEVVFFEGGALDEITQDDNGDYTGDFSYEAYFVGANGEPDANAGEEKTVKVLICLDEKSNYIFDTAADGVDPDDPTRMTVTTTATIEQAEAPDVTNKGSITVWNGLAKGYEYDFAGLLPEVPVSSVEGVEVTYGNVEYTFNKVGAKNGSEIDSNYLGGIAVDESNAAKVTLSTLAYDTTVEGQIGTLRMTVSTTNYEDFVLEAEVFAQNRKVPTGEPTISSSSITYGEELNRIILSGSMKDGETTVDGTFAWVDGSIRPDANEAYAAEWKFVPNSELYVPVTGTVNITVEKAEVTYAAPTANVDLLYLAVEQELIMPGASDDGTVMYSMSEDGWSEAVPVGRNAGDYTIYWYVKGDANHNDSQVGNLTVKIAPLNIATYVDEDYSGVVNIGYSYADLVYTGAAQSPVWTIKTTKPGKYNPPIGDNTPSVLLETMVLDKDYTVSVTPQTDAGEYTGNYAATITGKGNYTGSVSKHWNIAKAALSDGLGGTTTELVYTQTNGTIDLAKITGVPTGAGTVSYAVDTDTLPEGMTGASIDVKTLSFTLDGKGTKGSTYVVPVSVSSTNYETATVDMTVELIAKSQELLTVAMVGWTYGDTAKTPVFDMPDDATNLKVLYSKGGAAQPTETVPTNAGDYTVAVQYETATEIWTGGAEFTISPATLTGVTVEQVGELTYSGEEQVPTVSVKKGDAALSTDDYVLNVDAKADAGEYTMSVTGQGNYTGNVPGSWKIAKKAVTVTPVAGQSKVYGEADPVLTYTSDLSGVLAEKFAAAVTGALTRAAGEDAGTYAIGVGSLNAGSNFVLNFSEDTIVNFTVEKAAPVVPTDLSGYKDNKLSTVKLPEGWSWLNGDTVISGSDEQEFAASYAGSANYKAAENVMLTVKVAAKENKQLTVTINGWTYGDAANAPVFDVLADATNLKVVYSYNMTGTPTEVVPTDAGMHIVSVRYETATEIWTGGAEFVINPADLTGVSVEQVGELTYNGKAQTPEVAVSGKSVNDQEVTFSYTVSEAEFGDMPGFTDAGGYTVYYKASAANHNDATGQFTVTVKKATPVISEAKANVVYGQTVADSDITAVTGGVSGSFAWKNVTSYGDAAEAAKTFYADFTPNDSKNYNSVENIAVAVTVGQAAYTGNKVAEGSARYGADGTVNIGGCIAPGGTAANVSVVDNDGILAATPVLDGSELSYTLKNNAANVGKTATVNIEVTSGNYIGYTVAVTISVNAKDAQAALSLSGVGSDTDLIYGQTATLATVGGSGDGAVTYEVVAGGTGSAVISGNVLTATGTGTVYVRAIKAADAVYAEAVSDVVEVYIAKATPTGKPVYKAVNTSGKTLADAELTVEGGTFSVPGSVMWVDDEGNALSDETPIESNLVYKWVFVPTDSTNYENIGDGVILWKRSSGGGGGSSSNMGSSGTSVTVPVSSDHGSVKVDASVSKGTATVDVSDKQIDKVVADGAGSVTVDVSGLKNIDSATVPSHVVEKTSEAENTGLTVALPTGSVALDEKALDSVNGAADGKDVTVSVVSVPTNSLPATFRDAIGMEPTVVAVVDVDIMIKNAKGGSGTKQSSFGGGKVRISIPYVAKAGEDTSKLTVWFIRDDGTIEDLGGWYDAENKCFVFETDHLSRYVLVNTNGALSFVDVSANSWYAEAVNWAVALGVTNGYEANRFAPDMSCTRAQIVTFLWRAAGSPESAAVAGFSDVAAGAYYAGAVAWAVEQGITTGTSETMFSPDETCTRAQAVSFLFRYAAAQGMGAVTLQELVSGYGDAASVQGYALPAFNWALASGIVQGEDGKLLPNNDCTRAQIVTMLYRLLGK